MLFTDGSVNTHSKIGYGAYLAVFDRKLSLESLKTKVKVKRVEQTSSTKLELQTLLWALSDIQTLGCHVVVYTDSQNIIGLPSRRERLEAREYYSKNNKRLNNYELYEDFYRISDQIDFELVKVRGHQVTSQKNEIDKLFTLVDRAARSALRNE
ncbi:MAG: RNase H family protein [Methyloprofundus sp.]|uniref:ribonuclease HI n=1 Tax=Methyloprofundus sp. TaxID=2020875 RepID=UPI0026045602|nr:RNase H family protein [Methyloprofundus sp.]